MMRDKFSQREDRALHQALASVVMTQYPNPDRKGCPGTRILQAIAAKSIPMRDPAHEHVGNCSPCFAELTEIRHALHRRKLIWAMSTAAAALILAAVTYFASLRVNRPTREEALQPSSPVPTGGSIPIAPPSQAEYETALLDLRNASITRTAQPAGSSLTVQPPEIPRARLALTVQLPIGSEAGWYEVEIRKMNQSALSTATGQAAIEDGVTKLRISMETNSIRPGEYEFAWRPINFNWRSQPIVIR